MFSALVALQISVTINFSHVCWHRGEGCPGEGDPGGNYIKFWITLFCHPNISKQQSIQGKGFQRKGIQQKGFAVTFCVGFCRLPSSGRAFVMLLFLSSEGHYFFLLFFYFCKGICYFVMFHVKGEGNGIVHNLVILEVFCLQVPKTVTFVSCARD